MPIVNSFGAVERFDARVSLLATTPPDPMPSTQTGVWTDCDRYAAIYRTQPAVRTCVDFLARNMAQLGFNIFRRVSDTDRVRLADHELWRMLEYPNPATTRYKLTEGLMQDLCIYGRAYWLKIRQPPKPMGLVRLLPASVQVDGWLLPQMFYWTLPDGTVRAITPADIAYFAMYDPETLEPLSPLETLRLRLDEETAAVDFRAGYWRNAARLEGVVERPLAAPKWTKEQKDSWREQWVTRFSNQPGQTAVLEDGMTWKSIQQSWVESEYMSARKFAREEVASIYHIPLPMVGILDHATFSNIVEQHKQLYQDCLGPHCEHLKLEYERQLLPECKDTDRVYGEFNIADKLQGSFDEQSAGLQRLVGRPIMTANEGRARLNLPAITDDPTADALAFPLNQGTYDALLPPPAPSAQSQAAQLLAPVLASTFARQWTRLEKLPPDARAREFDLTRADRELARDLAPVLAAAQRLAPIETDADALAERINTDTLRRLVDGAANPFAGRGADVYV